MGEMQDEEERECVNTEKEEWRCSSRTFYVPVYRRLLPTSCMGLNKTKQRVLLGNLTSAMFIQHPIGHLMTLAFESCLVDRIQRDQGQHMGSLTLPSWHCSAAGMYMSQPTVHFPAQRGKFWPLILLSQSKMVSKLKDSWPWICDSKLLLLRKSFNRPWLSWRKRRRYSGHCCLGITPRGTWLLSHRHVH